MAPSLPWGLPAGSRSPRLSTGPGSPGGSSSPRPQWWRPWLDHATGTAPTWPALAALSELLHTTQASPTLAAVSPRDRGSAPCADLASAPQEPCVRALRPWAVSPTTGPVCLLLPNARARKSGSRLLVGTVPAFPALPPCVPLTQSHRSHVPCTCHRPPAPVAIPRGRVACKPWPRVTGG